MVNLAFNAGTLWIVLTGLSLVVSYYLARSNGRAGLGVGIALLFMGALVAVGSYVSISVQLFAGALVAASLLLTLSGYFVLRRNPRVFFLSGFLVLLVIQFFIFPFRPAFLFVYAAISLSITNAVEYSRVSVTLCMARADRNLRKLLWVFSRLETIVATVFKPSQRLAFAISYLTFQGFVVLVVPYLISQFTDGIVTFETMVLAIMILFVGSAEEYKKGMGRLN